MNSDTRDNVSRHILPTASNLLGICFLIVNLIGGSDRSHSTLLDDVAAVGAVVFMASSLFSYVSIRAHDPANVERFERWADAAFLLGLFVLTGAAILTARRLIH